MSREGQGKAKARSRRSQGKVKVKSRQYSHNLNHKYNLMGFDTIEINLVETNYCLNIVELLYFKLKLVHEGLKSAS